MRVMWRSAGSIIRKESCGRKMSEIRIQEVQEGAPLMDNTRGTVLSFRQCNTTWFISYIGASIAADLAILDQTHQRKSRKSRIRWKHSITYDYNGDLHADQGAVCALYILSEREHKSNHFSSRCIILARLQPMSMINQTLRIFCREESKNEKDIFNAAFYPGKRGYAE